MPLASTVLLNCTLPSSSDPLWSADLSSDSTPVRFQFKTHSGKLNTYGLYELPNVTNHETGMTTLRLVINNTAINNQTLIDCAGRFGESFLTTLFVFGMLCMYYYCCILSTNHIIINTEPNEHLILLVKGEKVNSINLTWSQKLASVPLVDNVMQMFLLNISHGSSSQTISVNVSHYYFTAPEDAPPCEVYNFSVTATYVGATYTGAGCSVPSQVLSTMLPSLPNINKIQPSLMYSLMKEGKEKIILNISIGVCYEHSSRTLACMYELCYSIILIGGTCL